VTPARFSEDDARRVFARAAERQRVAGPPADGLTLAELQEIGRAAGLDPDDIAAAVAELQAGDAAPGPVVAGLPAEWRTVRVLPSPVSDAAWEAMVAVLRKTFGAAGTASQIGRVREWSLPDAAHGGSDGVAVVLEPTEAGTRVTVTHVQRTLVRQVQQLMWAMPLLGLLFSAVPLLMGRPEMWLLPLLLVLVLSASVAGILWGARRARRRVRDQADALLDRIDLIARDDAVKASDERASSDERTSPALDLDALGDAADDRPTGARRRTRS